MENKTLDAILDLLTREGVRYELVRHQPTRTSEESAMARGTDVREGAKALLLKTCEGFNLFVISAAHKVDSQAIKERLRVKKLRFASADELTDLTGLESGAVPPLGRPILPFDLYLDPAILDNQRIAFNAGRRDASVIMQTEDYLRVARPTIFCFALID